MQEQTGAEITPLQRLVAIAQIFARGVVRLKTLGG